MKQYTVDAFAGQLFEGSPAAVCLLDRWPEDRLMQRIARENNLPETAFAVPWEDGWHLRWFTPEEELDLCGHATLAAAYTITRLEHPELKEVRFHTKSGLLTVKDLGDLLELDLPAYAPAQGEVTKEIVQALGVRPAEVWRARDLLCVLEREEDVIHLNPDPRAMEALGERLCIVTARGTEYDCVSRCFAPGCSIFEDPVTGSAHCLIVPYWAAKTGKRELAARQASPRGGTLYCRLELDRVKLAGRAVLYAQSDLMLEGML